MLSINRLLSRRHLLLGSTCIALFCCSNQTASAQTGSIDGWDYNVVTLDDPNDEYAEGTQSGIAGGSANSNVTVTSIGSVLGTIYSNSTGSCEAFEDDSPNSATSHHYRKRRYAFSKANASPISLCFDYSASYKTIFTNNGNIDEASMTTSIFLHGGPTQSNSDYLSIAGLAIGYSSHQDIQTVSGNKTYVIALIEGYATCTFYNSVGTDAYLYMQTGPATSSGQGEGSIILKMHTLTPNY
jgi:hypothetical protein